MRAITHPPISLTLASGSIGRSLSEIFVTLNAGDVR
jgi:hypothetical protein